MIYHNEINFTWLFETTKILKLLKQKIKAIKIYMRELNQVSYRHFPPQIISLH